LIDQNPQTLPQPKRDTGSNNKRDQSACNRFAIGPYKSDDQFKGLPMTGFDSVPPECWLL